MELSSIQDARSTVRMPRVEDGPELDSLPAAPERVPAAELDYEPSEPLADRPAAEREPQARPARRAVAGAARAAKPRTGPVQRVDPSLAEAAAETAAMEPAPEPAAPLPPASRTRTAAPAASHARPSESPAVSHARPADASAADEDEDGFGNGRRGRRSPGRRGFGLIVSGGCAGIAVAGFLVFGTGGGGGPAASTTATSSSAAHSSAGGTISIPAAPSSSAVTSSTASASASVSPSASKSPSRTPSSSPAVPSTSSSPSASASPTPKHTKNSPTSTATSCFLFICG